MSQTIDPYSLILLSIGLAMDAFSVAIVAGFGLGKIKKVDLLKISFTFGFAHFLMPIMGWILGSTVVTLIQNWDHWLAFIILVLIGGKMIKEGLDDSVEAISRDILRFSNLIMFTVAISIDGLAVGLSFSLNKLSIWVPSVYMGFGTFFLLL